MKRLPRLRTGDPGLDAAFEEWCEAIETSLTWTVDAPLQTRLGPEGRQIWLKGEERFRARLIGSASPYQFVEVFGTASHTWADLPGARTGDDAYEFNDVAGLDGKVVFLELLEDSTYGFQFVRQGPTPCDEGTALICVTVHNDCFSDPPAEGITITVKDSEGNTVDTCTTDADGVCCVEVPHTGTYTVIAQGDCGDPDETEVVVSACQEYEAELEVPGINFQVDYTGECGVAISGFPGGFPKVRITGAGVDQTISIPAGSFSGCVPRFASYNIEFQGGPCWEDQTDVVTLGSCDNPVFTFPVLNKRYSITGVVRGCTFEGQPGFLVEVTGDAGTGTDTTNADGTFEISGLKAGCDYALTISKDRYETVEDLGTMPCEDVEISVSMGAAEGYTCVGNCCDDPLAFPLTVQDAEGLHPLVLLGGGLSWSTACIVKPGITVNCARLGTPGSCEGVTFTSTVAYSYTLHCTPTGWQLQRAVTCCALFPAPTPVPGAADCGGPGGTIRMLPNPGSCSFEFTTNPVTAVTEIAPNQDGNPCGPLNLTFNFSQFFGDSANVTDS